ncbi:MAG TPA: hypothetical protein VM911_21640 [Pyrinomonadaceae bacterium]|jgi:hypothetical protein|nr:hypothetical protein [Pyrinomonadaceae bacterium]
MKIYLLAITAIFALTGCELPKEDNRFTSARLAPDGKRGVFVFKRELYYPAKMGLLGSGQEARYLVNLSIIGVYDMASGKVRVLHRRDNGNVYIHENADFHVREIQGSKALMTDDDRKHYWLDLESGELTALPLAEELAARGREPGVLYLVDEKGTLISVNKPLPGQPKTSSTEEIWLRRASGEYERISEVRPMADGYYGFKEDEVHFYSAAERAYLIYNLDSRTFRKGNPREIPRRSYDQVIDFRAGEHGSPQPLIGRKIDGKWDYQEVKINTEELR